MIHEALCCTAELCLKRCSLQDNWTVCELLCGGTVVHMKRVLQPLWGGQTDHYKGTVNCSPLGDMCSRVVERNIGSESWVYTHGLGLNFPRGSGEGEEHSNLRRKWKSIIPQHNGIFKLMLHKNMYTVNELQSRSLVVLDQHYKTCCIKHKTEKQ
jgi:hypothetical protein